MKHARLQMRAAAKAWRLTNNPCDLFAAMLWREKALTGVIRIPVEDAVLECEQ